MTHSELSHVADFVLLDGVLMKSTHLFAVSCKVLYLGNRRVESLLDSHDVTKVQSQYLWLGEDPGILKQLKTQLLETTSDLNRTVYGLLDLVVHVDFGPLVEVVSQVLQVADGLCT